MHPRHLASPPVAPPPAAIYVAQRHSIDRWHIVISGFTQSLRRPNGSELLWGLIRRTSEEGDGTCTEYWPWHSRWSDVADHIFRFRPLDAPGPRIHVYAYSWGGGWGFPHLARELGKRGLSIDTAVLCDPVYRNPLWSLAWLSFCRRRRVVVPANVRTVDWIYQRENYPRGHQVVAADPSKTIVHPGVRVAAEHAWMDDHPAYYERALRTARLGS